MQSVSNKPAEQHPRQFTLRDLILVMVVFGLVLGCAVEFSNSSQHLAWSEFARAGDSDLEFAAVLRALGVKYRSGSGGSGTTTSARILRQTGDDSYTLLDEPYDSRIMQLFRERIVARLQEANCRIDSVDQPRPEEFEDELLITYSTDEIRGYFSVRVVQHPNDPDEPDGHRIDVISRTHETPK